jgi:hypothetical protein
MPTALALAARARPGTGDALRSALATFSRSVDKRLNLNTRDRSKLTRGLAKLTPPEPADRVIDTSVIAPADGWAAVVLPELSTRAAAASSVNQLLRHLATAPGSKPSKAVAGRNRETGRRPGG